MFEMFGEMVVDLQNPNDHPEEGWQIYAPDGCYHGFTPGSFWGTDGVRYAICVPIEVSTAARELDEVLSCPL